MREAEGRGPAWMARLACPACRGRLERRTEVLACVHCAAVYPFRGGIPRFLAGEPAGTAEYGRIYEGCESFPRRLLAPGGFLHPVRFVGDRQGPRARNHHERLARFLGSFPLGSVILDVGSGSRRLSPAVVNLDLGAWPDVDVVASAEALPFGDGSVDGVVLQQVLEHLREPARAVSEAYRVLRPGGRFYAEVPFLYPVHAEEDFRRWTLAGLEELCRPLRRLDAGVCVEGGSALAAAVFAYGDERFRGLARPARVPLYGLLHVLCVAVRHLDLWPPPRAGRRIYGACFLEAER